MDWEGDTLFVPTGGDRENLEKCRKIPEKELKRGRARA